LDGSIIQSGLRDPTDYIIAVFRAFDHQSILLSLSFRGA
jgi:hypothetical protein